MVAKFRFCGTPAAERRREMSENEAFPIFAYLRAIERARENNRFSVLKTRAADKRMGHSAAREFRYVETRFIASHPLGGTPRIDILPHRKGHPGRERRDSSRLTRSGQRPAMTFLPTARAIRDVRDAMNRVTTQRTSNLTAPPSQCDAGPPPHGRPQRGRAISSRGWSVAEPAVRTHPTMIASKRRLYPKPPRA